MAVVKQSFKDLRRSTTYRLIMCIEQNNLEVLQHFLAGMEALGAHGVIYSKKREIGHSRQVYRLNYDGQNAMRVIGILLPMLVRKRAEALVALAYWTEGEVGRRFGRRGMPAHITEIRERLYRKLRSLK